MRSTKVGQGYSPVCARLPGWRYVLVFHPQLAGQCLLGIPGTLAFLYWGATYLQEKPDKIYPGYVYTSVIEQLLRAVPPSRNLFCRSYTSHSPRSRETPASRVYEGALQVLLVAVVPSVLARTDNVSDEPWPAAQLLGIE